MKKLFAVADVGALTLSAGVEGYFPYTIVASASS